MIAQGGPESVGAKRPYFDRWLSSIFRYIDDGMTHSEAAARVSSENPVLVPCVRVEASLNRNGIGPDDAFSKLVMAYRVAGFQLDEAQRQVLNNHRDLVGEIF